MSPAIFDDTRLMRPEEIANREWWDAVAPHHTESEFYDVDAFRAGANTLRDIELRLLGDVSGLRLLHLQCHFGLDTLSWARLGASVVGIDYSRPAITAAEALAEELGIDASFVCCEVYEAREHVDGLFDVVFASYGAMPWLPDIEAWAATAAACLRPGGRLLVIDQHPVASLFACPGGTELKVVRSYFDRGVIETTGSGSYVPDIDVGDHTTYEWHRPLADIVAALLASGLTIDLLEEHPFVPFRWFEGMALDPKTGWRLPGDPIPLLYALGASRRR